MPNSFIPANAEGLPKFSRRSIFKLAPAAVLATTGAVVAFPAKSEPLTLDQEIEASIELLNTLLKSKYRTVDNSIPCLTEIPSGGYMLTITGLTPRVEWSGDGYYEIFVRTADTEPTVLWVEECWDHLRNCTGYRGYGREKGQRISAYIYFPAHMIHIRRKVSV